MIPVLKVAEPTWVPRLLHGAYAEAHKKHPVHCGARATRIRQRTGCGCDGLSGPSLQGLRDPSRASGLRAAAFPTPARLTELFLVLISVEAAQLLGTQNC